VAYPADLASDDVLSEDPIGRVSLARRHEASSVRQKEVQARGLRGPFLSAPILDRQQGILHRPDDLLHGNVSLEPATGDAPNPPQDPEERQLAVSSSSPVAEQVRRLCRRLEPRTNLFEFRYGAVMGEYPATEMERMGVGRRGDAYTRRTNVGYHDSSVDELRRCIEPQVLVSGTASTLHHRQGVHIVGDAPSIRMCEPTRIQAALLQKGVLSS
jgi:hypothetical protein